MDFLPNEILVMILSQVSLEDLVACMEASNRLKAFIKAAFLAQGPFSSILADINESLRSLVTQADHESQDYTSEAETLLKFDELDVNFYLNGMPLVTHALAREKCGIASLMLNRQDLNVNAADEHEKCPIHVAARLGLSDIVCKIIHHKQYVKGLLTITGSTPLHEACVFDKPNLKTVRILLEAGDSPVDQLDRGGKSALHKAAFSGQTDVCRLLISHGADPNLSGGGLRNLDPIHWAVRGGSTGVVEYLLSVPSVDPNSLDDEGDTPLLAAVKRGHIVTALMLVTNPRVDLRIADSSGLTATEVANANVPMYQGYFYDRFLEEVHKREMMY